MLKLCDAGANSSPTVCIRDAPTRALCHRMGHRTISFDRGDAGKYDLVLFSVRNGSPGRQDASSEWHSAGHIVPTLGFPSRRPPTDTADAHGAINPSPQDPGPSHSPSQSFLPSLGTSAERFSDVSVQAEPVEHEEAVSKRPFRAIGKDPLPG